MLYEAAGQVKAVNVVESQTEDTVCYTSAPSAGGGFYSDLLISSRLSSLLLYAYLTEEDSRKMRPEWQL